MKVLIVDDKSSRYSGFFEHLGRAYQESVEFCTSVKEAINRLDDTVYDLLVIDMMLPPAPWKGPEASGGAEVLEVISMSQVNRPKYIVGITAATIDDQKVIDSFAKTVWTLLRVLPGDNTWEKRLHDIFLHIQKVRVQAPPPAYLTDVCVITALRKPEFSALLSLPLSWSDEIELDSNTFVREGQLSSNGEMISVIGANCSRMGTVETALLCSKLIQKYRPRLLVMTGICAGIKKLNFGDVIAAAPAWDWQSVKVVQDDDGKKTVLPALDFIGTEVEITNRLESLADDANFWFSVKNEFVGECPDTTLQLKVGPLGSGSMLIADGETIETVKNTQNKDLLGLEMEAYAIYAAARNANRPKPVPLAIKSVCDYGNYLKDDKYQKYAAYTSAKCFFEFIKRYGSDIKRLIK
jgi:nucleoside phosphorylase